MKTYFYLLLIVILTILMQTSCSKENTEDKIEYSKFLSDIRLNYFENLNFESEEVVANIPYFLEEFYNIYNDLEEEYNEGLFTSTSDLENMRLLKMYYSFYILGITGTYLDGNLTFNNINGDRSFGLFSKLNSNNSNFEQLEMEAMMDKAQNVIYDGFQLNGHNDKAFGFYIAVKQVNERLKNNKNNNFTSEEAHDHTIDYVSTRLVDYNEIESWNVLMSMVTMTDYNDPNNTFDNPKMDDLLFHVNARLEPGSLPDLGGKYPEILGPLYRFDLNLKKIDWLMHSKDDTEPLTEEYIKEIDKHVTYLENASSFVEKERGELLDSWIHKYTYDERINKMDELIEYRNSVVNNELTVKPVLKGFINSVNFKKAYQCYSCHRYSGLY